MKISLSLQTSLPEGMSKQFYRYHAELVYGNIPLDASWATQTQVWTTYLEQLKA